MSGGGNGKDASSPEATGDAEDAGGAATSDREAGLQELPPTREQLDALRRERDELKDALLRRRAELENFRKRAEREQQQAAAEAAAGVLRRLVETVDNLERALQAEGGEQGLRRGVELTLRDFLNSLEALEVAPLQPLGKPFDPEQHQALQMEDVPGYGKGTVAEVFRAGYRFKDRLLRPALVKVASGPAEEDAGGVDSGGDGEVQ